MKWLVGPPRVTLNPAQMQAYYSAGEVVRAPLGLLSLVRHWTESNTQHLLLLVLSWLQCELLLQSITEALLVVTQDSNNMILIIKFLKLQCFTKKRTIIKKIELHTVKRIKTEEKSLLIKVCFKKWWLKWWYWLTKPVLLWQVVSESRSPGSTVTPPSSASTQEQPADSIQRPSGRAWMN